MPGMGHRREDLTSYPVLFWPVGAYLIIYRAERQPIEIVAVTQGSRDIPALKRILEVNALSKVTKAVVEAARESLVIGQA